MYNCKLPDYTAATMAVSTVVPGKIRSTVIDKSSTNRTNRIELRYPIIIYPVHGSPDGRKLPGEMQALLTSSDIAAEEHINLSLDSVYLSTHHNDERVQY